MSTGITSYHIHNQYTPNTIPIPKPNKNPDNSITISEDMCKSLSLIQTYLHHYRSSYGSDVKILHLGLVLTLPYL